jgi:hypothetical protein
MTSSMTNTVLARMIISPTTIVLVMAKMATMATMNPRNLIRYVLLLLRVSMCTCHGAVCKTASRHFRRMTFEGRHKMIHN